MKASLLAVGTELTSGQIVNGNAAWISQRLSQLGIPVEIHITVPDQREAILEALQLMEKKTDFIFVTGGLGPTSDDFTRELIAKWTQKPLEFHETSWKKIETRLTERGLPVGEFQKQQCYFPQGSQVLENSPGTANAFFIEKASLKIWVLPGPPSEIEAIWNDHIAAQLAVFTQNIDPYMTESWDNLGLGEALAPTLVEPLVAGTGVEIGYRVHLPYLEIKISFYKSEQNKLQPLIKKIDEVLQNYVVSRNGEDILQKLQPLIPTTEPLWICDPVTQGALLSRIQHVRKQNWTYTTDPDQQAPEKSWQIHCSPLNDHEFEISLTSKKHSPFRKVIRSPYKPLPQLSERQRKYFAEMILVSCYQYWKS